MKVALAQINPIIGAFQKNSEKILHFVEKARKRNADLVVFPELSLIGYPPLDLLDKDHFVEDNLKALQALIKQIDGISAIIGYVEKNRSQHGKPYYNAAALVSSRKIVSKHYKSLLPSYDVFDETRHFEPSPKIVPAKIQKNLVAISICEDIWNDKDFWKRRLYKSDPLPLFLKQKKQCLLNISASPFSIGKQKIRKEMIQAIARKYKTPIIYVNQVGSNDQIIFDGASLAMNAKGEVIGQCRDFEEDMVIVDLDTQKGEIHAVSEKEIEAAYKALILGIRDYVTKCNFKRVLIGLSGGIDSAPLPPGGAALVL
ncbi:MAG: nitrilase-related carbon-nitrogen hydrolase, partial [Deltaproteobacteria bacterium]